MLGLLLAFEPPHLELGHALVILVVVVVVAAVALYGHGHGGPPTDPPI